MSDSIDQRFTRIVREMDAELKDAHKEIADLKSNLRMANFPVKQATNCGRCKQFKHTPWRDDDNGYGYVCASCLVEINAEEIAEFKNALKQISEQKLSAEMNEEERDQANWQGGYESVVLQARRALDSCTVIGQCDTCRDMAEFDYSAIPCACGNSGCDGTILFKRKKIDS